MTNGRGKNEEFGLTAYAYARGVVMDILGVPREPIKAAPLEWGNTFEYEARQAYQFATMSDVPEILDSIQHPTVPYVCGIPDGLVGDDGIIEIKCPFNRDVHYQNLESPDQALKDYRWQIQGYLWITGRSWCDFVSYHPDFPEGMKIAIHRIQRSDTDILILADRCARFWDIVQHELKRFKSK